MNQRRGEGTSRLDASRKADSYASADDVRDPELRRRREESTIRVFDVGPKRIDSLDSSTPHRDELAPYPGGSVRRHPVALVVDDEQVIASLIRQLLVRHGWHAIVVADAEDALSEHAAREIDLLVTDVELPGITGVALVEQLRQRDPGLPVIVVSGWPDAAGLVESNRVAFVPKPIDLDEFMNQVLSLAS